RRAPRSTECAARSASRAQTRRCWRRSPDRAPTRAGDRIAAAGPLAWAPLAAGGSASAWRSAAPRDDVGGLPGPVLAAVEGQHLPGERRRRQNKADGGRDLLRFGAAAEQGRLEFGAELSLGLMGALEHRPRADGIDANGGRQRLRQGARDRPQAGLGGGIGEKLRRRLQYALIDDVDDVAG